VKSDLNPFPAIALSCLAITLLLCRNYCYQDFLQRNSYYALEVTYPDSPMPMVFANRSVIKITLDGSSNDKLNIEFARGAIKELIHQQGASRGIEFTITDQAKYSSLVALFNICLKEEARYYVSYDDKFFVFNRSPGRWR